MIKAETAALPSLAKSKPYTGKSRRLGTRCRICPFHVYHVLLSCQLRGPGVSIFRVQGSGGRQTDALQSLNPEPQTLKPLRSANAMCTGLDKFSKSKSKQSSRGHDVVITGLRSRTEVLVYSLKVPLSYLYIPYRSPPA